MFCLAWLACLSSGQEKALIDCDFSCVKIGVDLTKTLLKTLRFPAKCFTAQKKKLDITQIQAILLKLNRKDDRPLAFDQLQIVTV